MSVCLLRFARWTSAQAFILACAVALTGCAAMSPPVTPSQVAGFTAHLADQLAVVPEPLIGPLTVDDAVNRAVHFNHAIRAKELEAALADAKVRAQGGAMLPSLVAELDYYQRDRPMMSRSSQSSVYSGSTDLRSVSRDIALSWNILDFGLSYVRSRQSLDKALQQHEEARRVRARIVEETRSIFWRAVALQMLGPAQSRLEREVSEAIRLARKAAHDLQVDPMIQVTFQRDMLNLQRDLNQLDAGLAGSMDQLKASIGMPLLDRLELQSRRSLADLPPVIESADEDVRMALSQRPEIRQHMYDLRITEDEIKATILQVLPGITLNRTLAGDSNSFLYHSNWISWGTRIAGNLMNLVRLPSDLDVIGVQQEVHRQNALATAAAIAMQVHVARARIAIQKRTYRDAERFADAQRHLLGQVHTSVKLGRIGQSALTREKLASLQADVRLVLAFADLHAAFAAYATARGEEPLAADGWSTIAVVTGSIGGIAETGAGSRVIVGGCNIFASGGPCVEQPDVRIPSR
jgi:outer membrane protein TolC